MRSLAAAATTAALVLLALPAHAMPPDFDGERGLEGTLFLGGGSPFDTSERLFWSSNQAVASAPNAIHGGFDLGGAIGYRFLPFLSAGVNAHVLFVSADPVLGTMTAFDTGASCYALGVYARLYPATFLFHAMDTRRVAFTGLFDPRRLDPWVSLGIEYEMLTRTQSMAGALRGSTWYRQSIGVPLTVGLDVRLIPALAVGLSLGLAPWFGGWVDQVTYNIDSSGNQTHTQNSYVSVDAVDAAWFIGLDARYTFTW